MRNTVAVMNTKGGVGKSTLVLSLAETLSAQFGKNVLIIDSDSHGCETLPNTRWGVATARRAWLTAADVANTLPWKDFAPLRKRAK